MSDRLELTRKALTDAEQFRKLDLTREQMEEAMRQMEEIAVEREELARKIKDMCGYEPSMMPWTEWTKSVKHRNGKEKKARRLYRRK